MMKAYHIVNKNDIYKGMERCYLIPRDLELDKKKEKQLWNLWSEYIETETDDNTKENIVEYYYRLKQYDDNIEIYCFSDVNVQDEEMQFIGIDICIEQESIIENSYDKFECLNDSKLFDNESEADEFIKNAKLGTYWGKLEKWYVYKLMLK